MNTALAFLDSETQGTFLEALRSLYRLTDLASFPKVALTAIGQLVPSVFSSYNQLNLKTGAVTIVFEPESAAAIAAPRIAELHRLQQQHPLLMEYQKTGGGEVQTISDFVPWGEWQRREIFHKVFVPMGIGESLSFAVYTSTLTSLFFVLNREEPTFTAPERATLNLLRPHLTQAYENAEAYTAARTAAQLGSPASERLRQALIVIDEQNNILHLGDAAGTLLDRYFRNTAQLPRRLPEDLAIWAKSQMAEVLPPAAPKNWMDPEGRDQRLRTRLTGQGGEWTLLLEETGAAPDAQRLTTLGLSAREAEVLYWVTQGKSNQQLSDILKISVRTVEKHLERIYGKLGVEARGQAMCVAAAHLAEMG